jgi:hypothetical protein
MSDDLEDLTPRRHTMEGRVATLEAASDTHAVKIGDHGGLLTAMDKDVSDAQAAFRAQLAVLNAVRENQSEQTATLREHTATLRDHGAMLRDHGAMLRDHGAMLRGHTATLRGHTATLRDHSAMLEDHTERLERLEEGQGKVLVGIQTIIGLLPSADGGERPGVNSPN